MPPPMKAGALDTQAALILPDPVNQHDAAAAPAGNLTNRVATAPSAPPRLGVLQRIGRAIKNTLGSIFCVRRAPPARASGPQQRQEAFAQSRFAARLGIGERFDIAEQRGEGVLSSWLAEATKSTRIRSAA